MLNGDLFSIDAAAHLRKVAGHTFRLPAYYPVECVRTALRRGATRVDIGWRRGRLQIVDNGPAITPAELQALRLVFSPDDDAQAREQAIAGFVSVQGIGLLAMFAIAAERVELETGDGGRRRRFVLNDGRMTETEAPPGSGTFIRLTVPGHSWQAETDALRLYCRFASAGIFLNGAPLGGGLALPRALAFQPLRREGEVIGVIGIPPAGHFPHVWLLDAGICWAWLALPAREGLVWEAALEQDDPGGGDRAELDEAAAGLYRWLARHWGDYAPDQRGRIEELLFDRLRSAVDHGLARDFRPFRMAGKRVSLEELAHSAGREPLAYVLEEGHAASRMLQLSRRQADFLVNHCLLPLRRHFPDWRTGWGERVRGAWRRLRKRLPAGSPRWPQPIDGDALSSRESAFLALAASRLRLTPDGGAPRDCVPMMARGRWGRPAVVVPAGESLRLLLKRRHRLVRRVISVVVEDPSMLEPAMGLLLPEWGATVKS